MRAPERRLQLLESAAQLIVDEGVDAVTMERVALVARVSKPVVYAHFANAEEVVAAVAAREGERLDAQVFQRLSTATTFEQRLDALMAPYLDAFLEPGSLFRPLALHRGDGSRSDGNRTQGVLLFLAEEILREFDIRRRDAGLAAAALYGAFETISMYTLVTGGRRADLDRVMKAIVVGGLAELTRRQPPRRR